MDKSSSKPSFFSFSPLKSNLKSSSAKAKSLCWQKSVKEENANWTTVDRSELTPTPEEARRSRMSRRRCSVPCAMPLAVDMQSRKPSLKSIQIMKLGSNEVPSPSNSISSTEENELTEEQRKELRKAFVMFEKGGKNKMAARDLGALLRCLGWNPSERELEEAKHELVVSSRGSVTFAEIERYMARRGGILYGCQDKEDIQEAFQVLDGDGDGKISIRDFRYFMTTMGEKMTDEEVEDMLQSVYKRKHTNFDSIEFHDIIEGLNETTLEDPQNEKLLKENASK
ncbi:uncharacterized protein LOC127857355 [Dreissena polymorpha]|uniref:uncharacterized protein LOC127857355 n=1 Tax=Dreissena polymorpha TaxID=45954 RepID=UPI002263C1CA|nr:uncharacterized protein LOC127857355 [Dreissena polymorpha]